MQVIVKTWRGSRTMELETALTPEGMDRDGATERAQATADAACEAMGRLLATLVEKKTLALQEAQAISGVSGELEFTQ